MRDLSSETALPQQGQHMRPHALNPGASDAHPNDHECGDQCYEDQVIKQRRATLVAPKTLEHVLTLKIFTKTKH
jgi:hypothetical protein